MAARTAAEAVTHESYTILSWLVRRRAPTERYHIERVLEACGALSLIGFLNVSLALSLKDAYWIRPVGSRQCWEDVSLYRRRRFRDDIAAAALTGWKLPLANVRPPVLSPEFTTDEYL